MSLHKGWIIGAVILVVIIAGVLVRSYVIGSAPDDRVSQAFVPSPTEVGAATVVASSTPASSSTPKVTQTQVMRTSAPAPSLVATTSLTAIIEAQPTFTQVVAPLSAVPTSLPTPTATPPCNQAAAGVPLDVSVPDGAKFTPGEEFVKTWRITNTGSCTWTSQYALVWVSGEQMASLKEVAWGNNIAPGETLEVSVPMVAPPAPGIHQSGWLLLSPTGEQFGMGVNGSSALTARIEVTAAATVTPTPTTGSISGRAVLNGAPVMGVNLMLENQSYVTIASAQTAQDGTFTLTNLPANQDGYSLVFTQESQPQYAVDQVLSWSWIGPIPLGGGASVVLPDFEIGLAGFNHFSPAPDSSYPAASISASNPLLFDWTAYAGATSYWVDISQGEEQAWVWQSALVVGPPVVFDGILFSGAPVQPGDYWWGVGAQKPLGAYTQTIYSYLVGFGIDP